MTLPSDAARYLDEWLGPGWTATPLAGDASVRAYYRVAVPGGETYMLAYYPEEVRSQLQRFLAAYEAIAEQGNVPEVLHACELAVLQRDAGDRSLFDVLHENREEGVRLYRDAVDMLVRFQGAGGRASRPPAAGVSPDAETPAGRKPGGSGQDARPPNPPFTADFFFAELEMARDFYVGRLMGCSAEGLASLLKKLCDEIARHPYVLCHRDYHGQNIHVQNGTLYLIDYQDMRMGPDTYDMASLLRDRGVARILGDDAELEMLEHYRELLGADEHIRRRYFETLLQRSIKILGTFSKQPIVRGRMHYLDFIPATLESIRRCLDELPRYAAIRDIFPLDFDLERARRRARSSHG